MNFKHGYRDHALYNVWCLMKRRCYNANHKQFKDWGGRGIIMCDEWKNSAKSFIEWALLLWKPGLQIDRRDNDGNYNTKNCQFVTPKINNHNQRLLRSTNKSGFRGVQYDVVRKKWKATICINRKIEYLGYFNSPELAAVAYDNAVPDNRPRNLYVAH